MATTQNTYTGNGSTTNYTFSFEYIAQSDVKVTLDTVATTAYTFANATTLSFTTAPANGVAIRIYRDTNIDNLQSTFFPGSAIKAEDLNNNFTQSHFAVQETDNEVITANTTASSAVTTANSAVTTANSAVTTANLADTKSDAAVATANTASTTAGSAVTTANAATTTANSASSAAASAVSTANAADTKADTAISTANTASSNASTAVSTANSANTAAANAVTTADAATVTANNATTTANSAVTTANTANTNATAAQSAATTAQASATAAQTSATAAQTSATAAQAQATLAADVRNAFTITDSNSDGTFDFVVGDIPIKGNNGVKLPFESVTYAEEGAIRYNNSLDKIELYNGAGQWVTAAGGAAVSSSPPSLPSAGDVWYDHDNGRAYVYYNDGDSNQWVEMNPSWNGYVADNSINSAKIIDGAIVNADVNASAAIAGTKISPDFGSQNVVTTGSLGVGTSSPTTKLEINGGTDNNIVRIVSTDANANIEFADNTTTSGCQIGANGDNLKFGISGTEAMRIDSSGRLLVGTGIPGDTSADDLVVSSGSNTGITIRSGTSNTSALYMSDGTSGADQYRGYVFYHHSGDFMQFGTNGSNAMRIDSSGNVGIGTTSPLSSSGFTGVTASGSTGGIYWLAKAGAQKGYLYGADNDVTLASTDTSGVIRFLSGGNSERMRLDSSGRLGLSTSVPNANIHIGGTEPHIDIGSGNRGKIGFKNHDVFIGTSSSSGSIIFKNSIVSTDSPADSGIERMKIDANGFVNIGANTIPSSTPGMQLYGAGNLIFCKRSNTGEAISFYANSTTKVGNIVLGASSTTYNTSSDYRLKENVVPLAGATERLKQLPVHRFNFIVEPDTTVDGFLAHEAQTVVPEAVTGEKDGEEMQGIDQSKLVPLLTAALQEAIAKIETLEAKVNALEGA